MRLFFYDTETTGIPAFKDPSHQPHIVQAAAIVVDADSREVIHCFTAVVKPDGWDIPAEVQAVHHITTEYASDVGIPEDLVTEAMLELWSRCDLRIGHSEQFDARILRIATKRFIKPPEIADRWKEGTSACTGQLSRPLCALPKNKMPIKDREAIAA
jgi:DNA polymerase-3 subunit epsilon